MNILVFSGALSYIRASDAPIAGGSFRYGYDGIGKLSDFIAWPES